MALDLPHSQFFHIQKTGGTWVRRAIANAGIPANEVGSPDFHNLEDIERLRGFFFHARPGQVHGNGKFRFLFVRNPLTWYQSMYAFHARGNWAHKQFPPASSFTQFVEYMLSEYPGGYVSRLYNAYDGVDYIGRFESLADDLVTALQTAGEIFNESMVRATPPENTASALPEWKEQCIYTDDLRRRVIETENDAFARFGFNTL